MKKVTLLLVTLLVVLSGPVRAEMVYYFDDQGKMHYVNTETTRVPEKYLPQVRDQMKKISQDRQGVYANAEAKRQDGLRNSGAASPNIPLSISRQKSAQSPLVEVYTGTNCADCEQWEATLRKNHVPYARYDINYHPHGQEVYAKVKTAIPFTIIGQEVIIGQDIDKVLSLLHTNK